MSAEPPESSCGGFLCSKAKEGNSMSMKKAVSMLFVSLLIIAPAGCGGGVSSTVSSSGGGNNGGSGAINLVWDAPTTNTDGTLVTDLAGYKIYYGPSSTYYTSVIVIFGNTPSYSLNNLPAGTYYITVTAYNASGNESGFSNEISRTL
jgi:hypothetical protein